MSSDQKETRPAGGHGSGYEEKGWRPRPAAQQPSQPPKPPANPASATTGKGAK